MAKTSIQIAPSILAGDFGQLANEALRLQEAGANAIHIDVMDAHFVPNLAFGPQAVAAINKATDLFLDVHLMMYNPYEYVERFVQAGADRITVHFEATEDIEETLQYIRRCNVQAGLAFCPETSQSFIPKFLDQCDLVLLMTVNPGFGGQQFMMEVLEKVRFTRDICDQLSIREGGKSFSKDSQEYAKSAPFLIQVDGGVDGETGPKCVESGANVLVSGTYLFKSKDMGKAIQRLKGQ